CIFVERRRRKKDEPIEKFKRRDDNELADLRRRLRRWARDNQEALLDPKPAIPEELQNRREDNWILLLAIADVCDGVEEFGARARVAAVAIEGKSDSKTLGVRLLADIKALFDADPTLETMHSIDIVKRLLDDPEKSWGEAFKTPRTVLVGRWVPTRSSRPTSPSTKWNSRATTAPISRRLGPSMCNVHSTPLLIRRSVEVVAPQAQVPRFEASERPSRRRFKTASLSYCRRRFDGSTVRKGVGDRKEQNDDRPQALWRDRGPPDQCRDVSPHHQRGDVE